MWQKPIEIPDDEKQKYLEIDNYRELFRLERDYHNELFNTSGMDNTRMNQLKQKIKN